MSLALHIICKDEVVNVYKIVEKYTKNCKIFDEICVAVDGEEAFEEIKNIEGVRAFKYEWDEDEKRLGFPKFDKKRNFLADKTNSEYYLRLDTDDEIRNPVMVREVYEKAVREGIDVIYVPYIYGVDSDGNCIAKHWRETIIRKSPNHFWFKKIHENILIKDQSKFKGAKESVFEIVHHVTPEHLKKSETRNFKILLDEFNQDKDKTDPRTLAYLGRMLQGMEVWDKAIIFLEMLVRRSGWDDDKYFAWVQLSQCHRNLGNNTEAIACCNEALAIKTEFPDAYLALGEIYLDQKDYKKALHWLSIGAVQKEPDTMFVLDPSVYSVRAVINLAIAHLGCGEYEKAKVFYDKAVELAPSNEFLKNNKSLFCDAHFNNEYFKHLHWMYFNTLEKDASKVEHLVNSIPKAMFKDERIQLLRNRHLPSRNWAENEIAIYCGRSFEEWGSPSVVSGIGGSEEAVIYLSKELVKQGYKVTVYNSCGDYEGEFEGVKYEPYWNANFRDNFNTFIAWRGNFYKVLDIKAHNKVIWMHDVPHPEQYGEGRGEEFDTVIVLSEFHKKLLTDINPNIPNEKIFVSANGINLKDFNAPDLERNPHRIIHTSSYDRGIEHLLNMWGDIRKEVPDAELHIFYGWNTYDRMVENGLRTPEFKNKLMPKLKQEGVFDHGRVGHKTLIKEFKKSGIYAYPCHFEEISCISAMKAQASGCVPVVTTYAALKETVKAGIKIEGKCGDGKINQKFKEKIIEILKSEELQRQIREDVLKHKEEFGWDRVAQSWSNNILSKHLVKA